MEGLPVYNPEKKDESNQLKLAIGDVITKTANVDAYTALPISTYVVDDPETRAMDPISPASYKLKGIINGRLTPKEQAEMRELGQRNLEGALDAMPNNLPSGNFAEQLNGSNLPPSSGGYVKAYHSSEWYEQVKPMPRVVIESQPGTMFIILDKREDGSVLAAKVAPIGSAVKSTGQKCFVIEPEYLTVGYFSKSDYYSQKVNVKQRPQEASGRL